MCLDNIHLPNSLSPSCRQCHLCMTIKQQIFWTNSPLRRYRKKEINSIFRRY
ncbi:hypothetical protein COCC4DRAFT_33078 [Bipolaris maydis ATCC 48331]|uniref:Uncharacterized protein n=2 Tax=Cochliobolus heterostrophus TaxID=5016 RepID=M2UJ11_COCH5|nr:uncharacterized protein COCC4DRAFT_33078 [Bipolaris maydis ATCC 48331]EMD87907.1 hypothetical protein COCHEDRAFT_1023223 [Bipolaris maydis C5]ENI03421.1 hypothetical protein COCC4DRAFT_33078 [Bipolaris maydis ATCC 48331]